MFSEDGSAAPPIPASPGHAGDVIRQAFRARFGDEVIVLDAAGEPAAVSARLKGDDIAGDEALIAVRDEVRRLRVAEADAVPGVMREMRTESVRIERMAHGVIKHPRRVCRP